MCSEVADLLAGPLVSDGAGEGKLLFDGLGIGHGWNIGYMYRFNDDRTRVGLTYRSAIRMRASGDVDWDFRDVSGNIPDITGVRRRRSGIAGRGAGIPADLAAGLHAALREAGQ